MYITLILLSLTQLFPYLNAENVTFKNITVHGYSVFTHKFKKFVISAENLNEITPKIVFDALEIRNEKIPILYENCVSNILPLDELILEENGIEEIQPGAFQNLPNLRLIKLKRNNLKLINAGVFNEHNLSHVSDIDLSFNEISSIEDDAFDDMPNLLNIRLTDNKLIKWNSNWFKNAPLLTRISVQHNLIEELPSNAFKNLMKSSTSYGRVTLHLNLLFSYNKIKKIHVDTFQNIKELNNLWLDNNELENIPEGIFTELSIENLKIGHNKLKCINKNILKADINDIDGNPFDCECMEDIKNWAKKENKTITFFYSDMDCYTKRLEVKMRNIEEMIKQMKINNLDEEKK